jgi:predicted phage-related endonuclease
MVITKEGDEMVPIEKRVDLHDERLNKQDDRLNQHSERLTQLEKWDEDKHRRLKEIEQNYVKLENTIVTENKEMRLFFQSNMDKQWDLIKSRDEQRHDSRRMRYELDKTKVERWSDIIFKLVGAGGLFYLVVQAIIGG